MEEEDTDENINIINFHTNKPNEIYGEKLLTKFNLPSKKIIEKNNKYKINTARSNINNNFREYLTNDPVFIEDFLFSIRLRFNDVFQKVKEHDKSLQDINEESNNDNFPEKNQKKKIDVNKVIEIQKVFKGYITRNIDSVSNRLRLRQCLIELFCLLIYGYWYKSKLRHSITLLERCYQIDKLIVINELNFEDKIAFKLPKCFYCGTKINNLKSDKLGKERK